MKCERCLNENLIYFYLDKENWYCRKCIQFGRVDVGKPLLPRNFPVKKHHCKAYLPFEMTSQQKLASDQLLTNVQQFKNTLVYACCGAGKTEITIASIQYALNSGLKVGFAIPRRQVVLEIASRFRSVFKHIKVIEVCQGYTSIDEGDLIVCTMHQLYRYNQTFDLLIMDEIDAYPYKENEMLEAIAKQACKGVSIYLSATPDKKILARCAQHEIELIELFVRPHGHPLVLPTLIYLPKGLQFVHMIYTLVHHPNQVLVYVPTIRLANQLDRYLKRVLTCDALTSKTVNKEEIVHRFQTKQKRVLFTTTIMERGITIKGVDIMVIQANHIVFDEASLIQIIGRVGRSVDCFGGLGIFYCSWKNESISRCVRGLRKMNEAL